MEISPEEEAADMRLAMVYRVSAHPYSPFCDLAQTQVFTIAGDRADGLRRWAGGGV
jgi:hypothetical protein